MKLRKQFYCIYNTSERIKYFKINLTKEIQDSYTENYTIPLKEVKENLTKWKEIPCSLIGRPNIKMERLPWLVWPSGLSAGL